MSDGRGRWRRPQQTLDRMFANSAPIPHCGCWVWMGATNQFGYGRALLDGQRMVAHRAAYILAHGNVPGDLELDHLCRVRSCINPDHLEPVEKLENIRRGIAGEWFAAQQRAKTHCPQGHPYAGDNLFIRKGRPHRECRACMKERNSRSPIHCEGVAA
jgi:hypothetical protein